VYWSLRMQKIWVRWLLLRPQLGRVQKGALRVPLIQARRQKEQEAWQHKDNELRVNAEIDLRIKFESRDQKLFLNQSLYLHQENHQKHPTPWDSRSTSEQHLVFVNDQVWNREWLGEL